MSNFVHLHNHSHFSLLDGACTPKALVYEAKNHGMPAVALTDHGNMFGALEFYLKAKEAGIKPILGFEAYIAVGSRLERTKHYYHLTLLARNFTGYKNLVKLTTKGYLEGFYYKPRIDHELLEEHSEGLVALSGCLKGEVVQLLLNGQYDAARRKALHLRKVFQGDFFIELQDHGLEEDRITRPALIKLARDLGIPLVAANDIHYARREHARAQEILLCINTGKNLSDPTRMQFATQELYFKSPEEMYSLFRDVPDSIENSLMVSELCNLDLPLGQNLMPKFPLPDKRHTLESYLGELAWNGMKERYGAEVPENIRQRLKYELSIINQMGFPGYFLVVKDFIDFAKKMDIPVGPGRGSAAGSLVSYCLGITNLDPIRYDLIFERFLNPERISMPDIDIDFCYERRDEIIQYVINKYGKENVAQIITFGSMNARAVIRDVGRAMGMPYGDVDKIAKLIPEKLGTTLEDALSAIPELKALEKSPGVEGELVKQARVLEGTVRHASTHAAGVVISSEPLVEYIPLYKHHGNAGAKEDSDDPQKTAIGEITTQYSMKYVEAIGLLKMDFLGLRTLTVINDTLRSLKARNVEIDLEHLPLSDPKTFELFGNGETIGVFQFESSGMRDYMKKLKPESVEDLIAMNALYRPGPMEMIDDFIDRKHGRKKIKYLHPSLEPILKETYGVIVYQEQVIRIASELAGFTLGKGDQLRRAMGKKIKEAMEAMRDEFTAGARKNNIPEKIAEEIFYLIDKFAGYGFNKSHAAGYALVAYQTAYLKANYPAEFLAATLTSEMYRTDRILILIDEAKRMGIEVLSPDVNASQWGFSVVGDHIRFGLGAIKNVGKTAVESIIRAREAKGRFHTIFDLCDSIDLRLVNKKVLESLIVSGAADSLEGSRAQKIAAVEMALSYGQAVQLERERGQGNLFGGAGDDESPAVRQMKLPEVEDWNMYRKLTEEKELLGFYISGHPLMQYEAELNMMTTAKIAELTALEHNTPVVIGGIVTTTKVITDKNNNPMAFLTIEDFSGSVEGIVFADPYRSFREYIFQDSMILIKGKVSHRKDEDAKIMCDEFTPLNKAFQKYARSLVISVDSASADAGLLKEIYSLVRENAGRCHLFFDVRTDDSSVIQRFHSRKYLVSPEKKFLDKLQELVGEKNVFVTNGK